MNWKKISVILSVIVLCVCIVGWAEYRFMRNSAPVFAVKVYKTDDNGYGYKIIRDERPLIVQPFIPGVPGKQPFRTSDDALRVGEMVLKRLKSGQIYSITPTDLNHLEVKYLME